MYKNIIFQKGIHLPIFAWPDEKHTAYLLLLDGIVPVASSTYTADVDGWSVYPSQYFRPLFFTHPGYARTISLWLCAG